MDFNSSILETKTYTEPELVSLLKQRENAAFRYLYLHYRSALNSIVLQILPTTENAEDILQEAFVQIWKNIDKYDESKGRLFTWMMKLTRNITINHTRAKNFRLYQKNEDLSNYVSHIEQGQALPASFNHIGLRKEVHRLRPEYKEVVELAYFQGFKQEEIAGILGIPLGTVKTRLRSAIIELRKVFV